MWITRRGSDRLPYARPVHWDRLFEDLEGQLAAEWEAERAALDAESERLRIAKLTLRTRLRLLHLNDAPLTLRLIDGERHSGRLRAVGADWVAAQTIDAPTALVVPIHALTGIDTHHGAILDALADDAPIADGVRERMTLGFLLRDFARRRLPLRVALIDGEILHGTIDRAGADHFDIAVHDASDARHAGAVRAFRLVPLAAVRWVRTATPGI